MIKKLILHFIFFGFSLFILSSLFSVQAIEIISEFNQNIVGVSCGVGGATDGSARCCDISTYGNQLKSIPDWAVTIANYIPPMGEIISGYNLKVTTLNKARTDLVAPCLNGTPSGDYKDPSCKCEQTTTSSAVLEVRVLCRKYLKKNMNEMGQCLSCVNSGGYYSGLGCTPLTLPALISQYVLGIGIGLAGGISLLCIMYSAFRMQTSQGNAEAIKKAQETLTSCITGLILIIFSVLILKLIAQDILRIPGFM